MISGSVVGGTAVSVQFGDGSAGITPAELLGRLRDVLTDVAALDAVALSDDQRVEVLRSVMAGATELTAAAARICLAVDSSAQWAADGARSSSAWIGRRTRTDSYAVRHDMRTATLLRDDLPKFAEAVAEGQISWAHVRVIAGFIGTNTGRRGGVAASEAILLRLARSVEPSRLWPALRRIGEAVDRDANDGGSWSDKRFLNVSRTLDGYHVTGWLDLVDGSLLRSTLRSIVDSSHRRGPEGPHAHSTQDSAFAEDPGFDAETDTRNTSTRMMDALIHMASHYAAVGELPKSGGFRPHIAVSVRAEVSNGSIRGFHDAHLHGTGGRREPIGHATMDRIGCDCTVSRVLFDTDDVPVAVGRSTRVIVPGLRLLLRERDDGCRFADCDRPSDWCEGHHIQHWSRGGRTEPANAVLLCAHHHKSVHEGGFTIRGDPSRALETRRSDGVLVGTTYPHRFAASRSP